MRPTIKLNKAGKAIFDDIVAYLAEKEQLESVDVHHISYAAWTGQQLADCIARVEKDGMIQTFQNGTSNVTGAYVALQREREAFNRACRLLGITPGGRDAVGIKAGKRRKDETGFSKLIKIAR